MASYRIKIAESDFTELERLVFADRPNEAGAFALAGVANHLSGTDIIVRRPVAVPKEQFTFQSAHRLEISSQAINGLIALCEANGLGAVLCHSHPEDIPYSPSDDHGEGRIGEALRQFIPKAPPIASLLFYPGGVRGRAWPAGEERPRSVSEILVVGRHLKRIGTANDRATTVLDFDGLYDRQVRAFGRAGHAQIARTRVGIVGVGGTGSVTAEQLARLGVTDFVLLDRDRFESSNLTRVYGTFGSSCRQRWWKFWKGKPWKADLVAAHIRRINPDARVRAIKENVVVHSAAATLLDCHVIFLCTDEHWGRSIVNQIAYQYLIPTINLGARITATEGTISSAVGTVDMLRPDMPCLWCSQFLRADRIAAESMPQRARETLEQEGYVEGIDSAAPSVVSITTAVSGMAVSLFLQLVTDFMGPGGEIARLNYNVMDSTVRRGRAMLSSQCVCRQVRGFGDLKRLHTLAEMPS
jgi:hypothetical protein